MAGFFGIIVVASPGVEGRVLQGAGKREGDGPREGAIFDRGSEIVCGLLWGLAAREEDYTSELGGDVIF